jgi:UDP-N-acetylglucosamine acyltransferase
MPIHPTAVVDREAEVDSTAQIDPYAIIEGPVRIGANTRVRSHAHVSGWTDIGPDCDIHPFAVVGNLPQDFHYKGERSYTRIGRSVVIREGATIHRGTQPESETVIGDGCLLMVYAHVGHNCRLAKDVKVYNMSALSGHIDVGEGVIVSGYNTTHQFIRIGKLAFLSANGRIGMDVPPFMTAFGQSTIVAHNVTGMRRAGYDREDMFEIRRAFRTLYRSGLAFGKAVAQLRDSLTTRACQCE